MRMDIDEKLCRDGHEKMRVRKGKACANLFLIDRSNEQHDLCSQAFRQLGKRYTRANCAILTPAYLHIQAAKLVGYKHVIARRRP